MRPYQNLSNGEVDALEALKQLGGHEVSTMRVAVRCARQSEKVRRHLVALEKDGRVTSSLSLDGLERLWSINGGKRAPAAAAEEVAHP